MLLFISYRNSRLLSMFGHTAERTETKPCDFERGGSFIKRNIPLYKNACALIIFGIYFMFCGNVLYAL